MPEYLQNSDVIWDDEPPVKKPPVSQGENVLTDEDVVWNKDPEPEPGPLGVVGHGLMHGTIGLAESMGTGLQWAGERIGSKPIAKAGETASKYWGEKAEPFGPPESIAGKNVIDDPSLLADATYWLYNVPDMIPALGASIVATLAAPQFAVPANASKALVLLAKLGRYVPAFAVGGGLEATQTYKSVLEAGGSEESAARSAELMGLGAGVLNAIGTGKILNIAGKKFKTRILQHFGAAGWEGLTEGLEEPTEVISKYLGKYLSDEELPNNLKEQLFQSLKDAATVAPIAAVTGGGASVLSGGKPTSETTTSDEINQVKADIKSGLISEGIKSGDLTSEMMAPAIERIATQDPALAKQLADMFVVKETDLSENERRFEEDPLDAENNAEFLDKYIKKSALSAENQRRIDAIAPEYLNPPKVQKLPSGFVEDSKGQIIQKEFYNKFISRIDSVLESSDTESSKRAEGISDAILETESELSEKEYVEFWEANLNKLDYLIQSPQGMENLRDQLKAEEEAGNISPEYATWWEQKLNRLEQIRQSDVGKEGLKKDLEAVSAPTSEKTKVALEEVGVEIPDFKTTGEAYAFGEKATPEQVKELQRLVKVQDTKFNELKKAGKLQEAMDEAIKHQFYNEALQKVEGTEQYKKFKPEPKEVPKTGTETEKKVKKVSLDSLEYRESGDAVGKEYHGRITAHNPKTKKEVGHIDYSYADNETAVRMIGVEPEYRRQGIGTKLLEKLQEDSKSPVKIQGTFATKEGKALFGKFEGAKPQPPKIEKPKPKLPRTEDLEGEGIGEGTSKRPKVEVGGKFYVPENKSSIEITKDYGKGTPKEDYPGMYRMDMSGWVEVTDLETGDKFPITRNDLVELGIEPTKAKKPETEKVEVTKEDIEAFIKPLHHKYYLEGQNKGIAVEKLNAYGALQINKLVGSKLRANVDMDAVKQYLKEHPTKVEVTKKAGVEIAPEKKEPWQMGENEYVQSRLEDLKGKIKLTGQARNLYLIEWQDKFTVTHQRSVEKAIQEGKLPKPKKEKVEVTPEKKEAWEMTPKEFEALVETPKTAYKLSGYEEKYGFSGKWTDSKAQELFIDKLSKSQKKKLDEYSKIEADVGKKKPQVSYDYHLGFVKQAISEGKTIPPEVLKDYPDLKIEEKVEVETTPEGKEISVDLTKKEEAAVTPKQQKEYLLAEIDKAIEAEAKKIIDVNPNANLKDTINLLGKGELVGTSEQYTFTVPNDGEFEIYGSNLPEFQRRVKSAFPSTITSKKFKPKVEARKGVPTAKYNKILGKAAKDLKPADIDRIFKEVADTEARDITGAVMLNPFQNWLLSQDITKAVKDKIRSVAGKDYIDEARVKIETQDLGYAKSMVEYTRNEYDYLRSYHSEYKTGEKTLKQIAKETEVKRSGHELAEEASNAKTAYYDAVAHLEKLEKPTDVKEPAGVRDEKAFATKEPYEKDLIAYHNTTATELLAALESGGLAMPSIAITRKDIPYEKYGPITLIGRKETIDPKGDRANRVFDSDIYSPRVPGKEWNVNQKEADKVYDRFESVMDEVGTYKYNFEEAMGKGKGEFIDHADSSNALKVAFLREQNIPIQIPKRKVPFLFSFSDTQALQEYLKSIPYSINSVGFQSKEHKELSQAVERGITEYAEDIETTKEEVESTVNLLKENHFSEKGFLNFNITGQLNSDQQTLKKKPTEVDKYKLEDRLKGKFTKKLSEQYLEWINKIAGPVYGEPFIKLGRKKVPYTLGNIVKAMKREGLKGEEKTPTFGPAKARAKAAKQISSIKAMHGLKDRLVTEEKVQEAIKDQEKVQDELTKELIDHYKYKDWRGNVDVWAALDDAMKATGAFLSGQVRTISRMQDILKRHDFENVSVQLARKAVNFSKVLMDTPTQYFELKSQKAVGFDEFEGAVIPTNASLKLKRRLKEAGLTIKTYKEYDTESRQKAVSFFHKKKGVLFSTTTKPQKTITREDLRLIFKRMKHIRTGQDKDGNLWFKATGRPKVAIYELDNITGHLNTSAGQIPVGSYLRDTIELKTGGEGHTADISTAYHELHHWLEKQQLLSANDITALNRVIAKDRGISESNVTEEHRAYYVGDNISAWETQKHPRIRRILRKLTDFMNAIYDFAAQAGWVKGRERTAEGVLRDISSGEILAEKKIASERAGELIPAYQMAGTKAIGAPTGQLVKAQEMLSHIATSKPTPLETILNRIFAGSKFSFNIPKSHPTMKEGDSGIDIKAKPLGGRAIIGDASTFEISGDSATINVKSFGDLSKVQAFVKHGFDFMDIESKRVVIANMISASRELKVRKAIVESIPVGMMNNLRRQKLSPDMLLHDQSMLQSLFAINLKSSIPIGMDIARSIIVSETPSIAKISLVDFRRYSVKDSPATVAKDFQHDIPSHKVSVTIPASEEGVKSKVIAGKTMPYESQGIPEDQWIITDGKGTSFSVEERRTGLGQWEKIGIPRISDYLNNDLQIKGERGNPFPDKMYRWASKKEWENIQKGQKAGLFWNTNLADIGYRNKEKLLFVITNSRDSSFVGELSQGHRQTLEADITEVYGYDKTSQLWKAIKFEEQKAFSVKGGKDYRDMLKRYQVKHTTPLVDETVDKTKIKHFDNLEKTSSQPDWIKDKFGREEKTLKEKIGDNVGAFRKNWQTRLLDRLHPIKALGETAYMLHRLETGAQATMAMFMRHGKLKWEGKALTIDTQKQGFMPWLDSLGDDAQKLFYWMAAKRAEVLETEGREKWLDTDTRKKIFDWVGEKPKSAKSWGILNNQFQDFNKSVLNLAQQSGLINPIKRAAWEQEFYVPFYRIFEDAVAREEFLKGPLMGKKHISAQIKRLLGAEMKIGDPLENVIRNWSHLIHESVRNMARAEAYDYAQKNKIKSSMIGEGDKLMPLIETVKASELNIYRSDKEKRMVYVTKKGDDNILSFQKNGRRIYFKVNDIEMFNALSDVNHRQFNGFLVRACGQAKRWLTYGATFGPAFKVANMLRDSLHTAIISKSFIPFIDSGKGIVKALREDADYVKFMASGAGFGSSYIRAENPQALAEYINRIVKKEGGGSVQRILDTPKKMLDFWEKLGAASENAARVMLYTKRIAEGETHLKAAFEGRDLMDFTMRGDSQVVQYLIRTVPFMNARAQGLYKLGRAAKQDPKSFMIKGSILTIATLALWAINRDKDEWKELEDWDKRTYYHFWIGSKHYRIPKPFETGAIFSTVFEGMAEVMSGDEEFGYFVDVMKDTFLDTFAMNPTPQAVRPLIEQWSNKSFFTGRPIEGQSLQRLKPGERKTAWTSETMQLAGKLGVSPKRAEEIIRGYFSTFGMFLLGISDIFSYHLADFPVTPTKEINDYPLLGRFIKERVPARHTKYQTKFYEMFREIDQLVATVNNHRRLGNYKEAVILSTKERKTLIKREGLLRIRKELTEINAKLRRTMASRVLTADQKRTKIDWLIERKNKITRNIYERYIE